MVVYKVSFVVVGSDHPGAILSMRDAPKAGDIIQLGDDRFEVTEVFELMPPRGDFYYYHATCQIIMAGKSSS